MSDQNENTNDKEDESLFDLVKDYVNDQIHLARLGAVENGALISGNLVYGFLISAVLTVLLLLGGIALVLWLGTPEYYFMDGVGYSAIIFGVLGLLIVLLRKPLIVNPIANRIIRKAFSNEQQ
jgi:hypothetical protein